MSFEATPNLTITKPNYSNINYVQNASLPTIDTSINNPIVMNTYAPVNQSSNVNQSYVMRNSRQVLNNSNVYGVNSGIVGTIPQQQFVNNISYVPANTYVSGGTLANTQILQTGQSGYIAQGARRSRIVPVTQYVEVFQQEPQVSQYVTEGQQIQQRVILHEPEAFPERKETKVETKVESVVRENTNPLVETIQGKWYGESKGFTPPAAPVKETKTCCSPWLLALLGLLALAGLLTAIFLGKSSSGSVKVDQGVSPTNVSPQVTTNYTPTVIPTITAPVAPIPVASAPPVVAKPTTYVSTIAPTMTTQVIQPSVTTTTQTVQPHSIAPIPVNSIVNGSSYTTTTTTYVTGVSPTSVNTTSVSIPSSTYTYNTGVTPMSVQPVPITSSNYTIIPTTTTTYPSTTTTTYPSTTYTTVNTTSTVVNPGTSYYLSPIDVIPTASPIKNTTSVTSTNNVNGTTTTSTTTTKTTVATSVPV